MKRHCRLTDWIELACGGFRSIQNHQSKIKIQLTLFAVLCATAAPTTALTPATLLNPQLEAQSINLAGLREGTLSFFDDDRRLTQAPVEGFVRLSLAGEPATGEASSDFSPPPMLGMIELVDGQRLAGSWTGATRDGEAIIWTHPTLGRCTLGLDDVRRVVVHGDPNATSASAAFDAATAEGDAVWLGNGDVLVGFIVSVGDDAVTILPDGAADEVSLSLETVARVTLANPMTGPGEAAATGDLVTLHDGSRVRGGGVSIVRETLRLTPALTDAMQPVELALDEVRQIDFAAAGLRLVELGDQPMQTVAGGSAFGLDFLPAVDETGVRLHAPVTVVFDLPEGVERFAATALLDLPAGLPEARAAWADLAVVVSADGSAEVLGEPMRLRADEPRGDLNLVLDGPPQLRIEVDPAANGPVLDRLLLQDAVLLIRVPQVEPGSGDATP